MQYTYTLLIHMFYLKEYNKQSRSSQNSTFEQIS